MILNKVGVKNSINQTTLFFFTDKRKFGVKTVDQSVIISPIYDSLDCLTDNYQFTFLKGRREGLNYLIAVDKGNETSFTSEGYADLMPISIDKESISFLGVRDTGKNNYSVLQFNKVWHTESKTIPSNAKITSYQIEEAADVIKKTYIISSTSRYWIVNKDVKALEMKSHKIYVSKNAIYFIGEGVHKLSLKNHNFYIKEINKLGYYATLIRNFLS